ncbi:MAG: hypothetical protein ABSA01_05540 [Anaerolineales bacterium]
MIIFSWEVTIFPACQDRSSANAIPIAQHLLTSVEHSKPGERFDVEMITRQHSRRDSSVCKALKEYSLVVGCLTII